MLKKVLLLVLFFIVSIYSTVQADWALIPVKDMIKEADVILIGYIDSAFGEGKTEYDSSEIYWKVKVTHYLKGDNNQKEYSVATPGSLSIAGRQSSIDYNLYTDRYALFFLKNNRPITPRGVVYLDVKEVEGFKKLTVGKEIADSINSLSGDMQADEHKEVIDFINSTNGNIPTVENILAAEKNDFPVIAVSIASIVLVIGVIYFYIRSNGVRG
jgi:hypothetical protein